MERRILLSANDFDFIRAHSQMIDLNRDLGLATRRRDGYEIIISDGNIEAILDELASLLASIGLQENLEPNSTGILIEHLIDIFNEYNQ